MHFSGNSNKKDRKTGSRKREKLETEKLIQEKTKKKLDNRKSQSSNNNTKKEIR